MSKKVLLVVMLVLCIAAGAGVFLLLQNKSRTEEMPQAGTQAESGTEMENTVTYQGETYEYNRNLRNVLFLGVDKEADSVVGETVGRNGQADCILLMIMNQGNKGDHAAADLQRFDDRCGNLRNYREPSGNGACADRASVCLWRE